MLKRHNPGCPCCECLSTIRVITRHCNSGNCVAGIKIRVYDEHHIQVGPTHTTTCPLGVSWTVAGEANYTLEFESPLDDDDNPLYVGPTTKAIPAISFAAGCESHTFTVELYDYYFTVEACVKLPCPGAALAGVSLTADLVTDCAGTLNGTATVDIDSSGIACVTFIGTNPIAGCAIQVTATPPGGKGYTECVYTTPTFELNSCKSSDIMVVDGCILGLDDGLICECPACHNPIPDTLFWSDEYGSCTLTYGANPMATGPAVCWVGGYNFVCPTGAAELHHGPDCCAASDGLTVDVVVLWYCGTFLKFAKICSLADCDTGLPGGPKIGSGAGFSYDPNPVACGSADLDCDGLPIVNQTTNLTAAACGRGFVIPCTESSATTVSS